MARIRSLVRLAVLMAVRVASSGLAAEAEPTTNKNEYLESNVLPLVRQFIKRNGIPFPVDFSTNEIAHWRVTFGDYPAATLASVNLKNHFIFGFTQRAGEKEINYFQDIQPSIPRVMTTSDPKEMRFLASRPNRLTAKTALDLAKKYFLLQGHKPENFHAPKFKQMGWGEKSDPDYIALPFYEAEWLRIDVKEAEPGSLYPKIHIIVSGLTANLACYDKLFMFIPVGTVGKGFETETGKSGQ
jgi:hypothetical protein